MLLARIPKKIIKWLRRLDHSTHHAIISQPASHPAISGARQPGRAPGGARAEPAGVSQSAAAPAGVRASAPLTCRTSMLGLLLLCATLVAVTFAAPQADEIKKLPVRMCLCLCLCSTLPPTPSPASTSSQLMCVCCSP
eukprot:COSAG01_NODE_15563_length_1321_cov_2.705065_1_plen_138_part_00